MNVRIVHANGILAVTDEATSEKWQQEILYIQSRQSFNKGLPAGWWTESERERDRVYLLAGATCARIERGLIREREEGRRRVGNWATLKDSVLLAGRAIGHIHVTRVIGSEGRSIKFN